MSTSVLTEELGPVGRRRVRIATVIGAAVLVAFLVWLVQRLAGEGQFAVRLWEKLWDWDNEVPQAFFRGIWGTLRGALGAMALASVLGLGLALGRLSKARPVRFVSGLVIDLFRGPPVLLLIFFSFYALPQILPGALGVAIARNQLYALIIGLTLYHMAILAEIFRAGILSLDRGQREAAMAVGMTPSQTMRIVVLPQALRRMIPSIVAQLATVTKDTSLGYIIGLQGDLMFYGRTISEFGVSNQLQTYVVVGVFYFVVVSMLSKLATRLEVKQRQRLGASAIHVEGEADVDAMAEDTAR